MSFASGPALEAQQHQDFDTLCTAITDGFYELSNSINVIRKLLSKLAANKATKASEDRLASVTEESTQKVKRLGDNVKQMAEWDPKQLSGTQKFTQQKLSKEFAGLLNDFRNLQRTAAETQRKRNEANKAALDQEQETERTPLIGNEQVQSQKLNVVNQQEVDFQSGLILEREAEIENIEQGVNEINAIFRDLGTLVSQQGAQIDTVEENVSNFASNSENASKQLRKADDYQRKRRNWSFCVFLVLFIVLAVIILGIFA